MKTFLRWLLATIALSTSSLAGMAQALDPDPGCALGDRARFEEVMFVLSGVWKISHHSGLAVAGGMTIPYGSANDNETVTITMVEPNTLVMDHPEAQNPVALQWAEQPGWIFEGRIGDQPLDPVPAKLLTAADLDLIMGCPYENMARLVGTSFAIVDGVQMSFTYRMMVADADQMFGIMHVYGYTQGMRFDSWRSVSLTR